MVLKNISVYIWLCAHYLNMFKYVDFSFFSANDNLFGIRIVCNYHIFIMPFIKLRYAAPRRKN